MKTLTLAFGMAIAATGGMAHAATHEHDMSQHLGIGEMKKGTLTIYAVPRNRQEPYVFSVE